MLGGRAPRTPATLGPARGVPEPGGSGARPGSRPTPWSQTAVAYILGKAPTKETNPIGADAPARGGAARLRWHGRWINKAPRVAGIAQQVRAPGCGPGGHRFDPGCSPQSFSHSCPSQPGASPPRSEAYARSRSGRRGQGHSVDRQGRRCRAMGDAVPRHPAAARGHPGVCDGFGAVGDARAPTAWVAQPPNPGSARMYRRTTGKNTYSLFSIFD
jgi:hypothetical protein